MYCEETDLIEMLKRLLERSGMADFHIFLYINQLYSSAA